MSSLMVPQVLLEILTRVRTFARSRKLPCYLVGGFLRDQLLQRAPAYLNVDLAVPQAASEFARTLAASLGGAFVPLDDVTDTRAS